MWFKCKSLKLLWDRMLVLIMISLSFISAMLYLINLRILVIILALWIRFFLSIVSIHSLCAIVCVKSPGKTKQSINTWTKDEKKTNLVNFSSEYSILTICFRLRQLLKLAIYIELSEWCAMCVCVQFGSEKECARLAHVT